jgi:methyltransferase-like protein
LARIQADNPGRITNLRHHLVDLDDFARLVLRQLDGRHDRSAIEAALAQAIRDDAFTLEKEGQTITDLGEVHGLMVEALDPCLRGLASNALLIG